MGAALTLRGVRIRRGGTEVLRIDSLDVPAGHRLAILGPNGSGKSTLLRALAGLDIPAAGTVDVDGTAARELQLEKRRRVALVAQHPTLLSATVRRNVELPLAWRKMDRGLRRSHATGWLERLGVAHLADRQAGDLSGGERARVALARALATDPDLLLLDEPATALDADARAELLLDLARALNGGRTTVVHVSHRPEEALVSADQVAVLIAGRLRQIGAPAAVVAAPMDAAVAALVGYDVLVPVTVQSDGRALAGRHWTGLRSERPPGPATAATWARHVAITHRSADGDSGVPARVLAALPGHGQWEVLLDGPGRLRVHLDWELQPPRPGDLVTVILDPGRTIVIGPTPASWTDD